MNSTSRSPRTLGASLACACCFAAGARAQGTSLVSIGVGDVPASGGSSWGSTSSDGRHGAFESSATNLVATPLFSDSNVFLHDRYTKRTKLVSVSSVGVPGELPRFGAAISGDGRLVAFLSSAPNLVAGDTNGASDAFVHDTVTSATPRISSSSSGAQAYGGTHSVSLSADGRFVAFGSVASNLVANDTNGVLDLFVHDRSTGATVRASESSSGEQGDVESAGWTLSRDGRYVVFSSQADHLVASDLNSEFDVFLHDLQTSSTSLVSVSSSGEQANFASATYGARANSPR
jgi:hypothetical protein